MTTPASPNRLAQHAQARRNPSGPVQVCPACRDRRYVLRAGQEWVRALTCQVCAKTCPLCDGATWKIEVDARGGLVSKPCECRIRSGRLARFNAAQVPARYLNAELETFLERGEPSLGAARLAAARLGMRFAPGLRGLGFSGPVGVGKTHLLIGVVRHVTLTHGHSARFVEFTHLLSELKAGFESGRSELDVLEPLVNVDLLVIDEVGKGLSTEWQLGILDELVSRRYNLGRTICFSTNFPFTGAGPRHKGSEAFEVTNFEERIGKRTASRLAEMCDWMTLQASDFRANSASRAPR